MNKKELSKATSSVKELNEEYQAIKIKLKDKVSVTRYLMLTYPKLTKQNVRAQKKNK